MNDDNLNDIELDYDDNDDTIDVNDVDFEIDNDTKDKIIKDLYVAKAEYELEEQLNKKQTSNSRGYKSLVISSLFLPMLISMFIVGIHSNKLITKPLHIIILCLIIILSIIFGLGLYKVTSSRKVTKKRRIKAWVKYIYFGFMSAYVVGCSIVLFLLYGPYNDFKDWLVTTAMQTKDHKYFCTWFYNDKEIDEVFSRNYIQEPEGNTDESLIDTGDETKPVVKEYKNEYERAVLEHEDGQLYKIINLKVNGCKGYLAVVYDPSMLHVTTTDRVGVRGQYVTTMAKREKALVAINGAGFHDPNYTSSGGCPKGITIVNGKIITNNEYGRAATGGLIGITKKNKLVLLRNVTAQQAINQGIRDAVSWGPFLVVNGKAAYTKGNGGWGYAARTAIGQRKDGIILMLVVDSNYNRTKGADMGDMTDIMVKYGAINASNLDGGTSSVMAVNGKLISHPIDSGLNNETRPVATAFVVRK